MDPDDPSLWCRTADCYERRDHAGPHVAANGMTLKCRPRAPAMAIYNLTELMLEWIDADHVINGLSPLDVGWTIEAPMRDRAQALDRLWTEDGRRQRVKGIASIWT